MPIGPAKIRFSGAVCSPTSDCPSPSSRQAHESRHTQSSRSAQVSRTRRGRDRSTTWADAVARGSRAAGQPEFRSEARRVSRSGITTDHIDGSRRLKNQFERACGIFGRDKANGHPNWIRERFAVSLQTPTITIKKASGTHSHRRSRYSYARSTGALALAVRGASLSTRGL